MKRNLTGDDAYLKMKSAEVPAQTASYTPIAHGDILKHLKAEIRQSGFMICGEDYKCNTDGPKYPGGSVALGLIRVLFQPDPDLVLCASFLNSYNKKHAFRFVLAGQVALTGNAIILGSDVYGLYRRVHTGKADILATGNMSAIIKGAADYWQAMVKFKEDLKLVTVPAQTQHEALASMFLRDNTLNGFQLNTIKEELTKVCDPVLDYQLNGWDFYNVVASAIKDAHPAEWMDVHMRVQVKFDELVLGNTTQTVAKHWQVIGVPAGTVGSFQRDEQGARREYQWYVSNNLPVRLESSLLDNAGFPTTWEVELDSTAATV